MNTKFHKKQKFEKYQFLSSKFVEFGGKLGKHSLPICFLLFFAKIPTSYILEKTAKKEKDDE